MRFVFFFFPAKPDTLLIIKNDGIGDYVLFRNYLKTIRDSTRFASWKIYLLTTPGCRDIVEDMDADFIDGCFWYADDFFLKWKLARLLFQLNCLRLHTIFYPAYSRKFSVDWLIRQVKAPVKIGVDGDTVNEPATVKLKTDIYYTELIPTKKEQVHEFERNRQIIADFTGSDCSLQRPVMTVGAGASKKGNYVVVFCGASNPARRWNATNFRALCKCLIEDTGLSVILTGGKDEIADANKIAEGLPTSLFSNETGKHPLHRICELIAGARLLITGDTVAVHIAASFSTPTVCLSKGDHYGRFVPYPKEIFNQLQVILPQTLQQPTRYYSSWSGHNINEISVQQVYSAAWSQLINPAYETS